VTNPDSFAEIFRRPVEAPAAVEADDTPATTPAPVPGFTKTDLDDMAESRLRERWPELVHAAAAGWIDLDR
jgi:hypothetical protein